MAGMKKDPYAGMKISLAKTVLTGGDPSLEKLETAFMEEFGEPPSTQIIKAFIKKLPVDKRPKPPLKPIRVTINLIKIQAKYFLEEQRQKKLQAEGGEYISLALDKATLDLLPRLQSVYGLETPEELITMAIKILEQQARGIAPEIFDH